MSGRRLVLFNGGLKSTFLAELARREGVAILCYFFLTDQDRARSMQVEKLAQTLKLKMVMKDLRYLRPRETLLQMLYLVLHALPYAKENYCDCIYHGLSKDDDPAIVRVMDAYVKQLNSLIELGQPLYDGKGGWLGQVSLETPLRRLIKGQVIRLGNEYSLSWELTHSCDIRTERHCGTCNGCNRRRAAFAQEGHEDSTRYIE